MGRCSTMFLAACVLWLAGCASTDVFTSPGVAEAQARIRSGQAECVLVRAGAFEERRGRGVMPLLDFYDQSPGHFSGAIVVDKVIGRAAAMIAIRGKARAVYGEIMSEDALELLQKHDVPAAYGELVPLILNAKRDGRCPLELAVAGVDDPAAAMRALRRRIGELKAAAKPRQERK